jgi:tRNA A37 threonylcarbamoyladenosine modification protein TsaB
VAAAQDTPARPLLVALDSRRDDIYVQLFGADGEPLSEPRAMLAGAVAGLLPRDRQAALAGDAADTVMATLGGFDPRPVRLAGPDLPDAGVVARLAAGRTPPPVGDVASPLYLRPPDAITAASRNAGQSR